MEGAEQSKVQTWHGIYCLLQWASLLLSSTNRPRSRYKRDAAVLRYRQLGPDTLTESRPSFLGERHGIAGSWALPAQEWRPVVIEIAKVRWCVYCSYFHTRQTRVLE